MRFSPHVPWLLMIPLLLAMAGGCGPVGVPGEVKNEPASIAHETTLYDRLGGGSAIYAIVDAFVDRAVADPRVNFARRGSAHPWIDSPDSLARLKLYWAQYIDVLADGPQVYEGRNLVEIHHGMNISEGEWVAMIGDLHQTLEDLGVPPELQKELLARVAATHGAIVNG